MPKLFGKVIFNQLILRRGMSDVDPVGPPGPPDAIMVNSTVSCINL